MHFGLEAACFSISFALIIRFVDVLFLTPVPHFGHYIFSFSRFRSRSRLALGGEETGGRERRQGDSGTRTKPAKFL